MIKTYAEGCIAAHALDLIGDRWSLLIARELMLGPKRFGALQAGLPGIATNMLTRRLSEMEAAAILRRRTAPPPISARIYELTESGLALWPVIAALCRWGAAMPGHDPRLPISPTALMLSMRATMDPDAAAREDRSAGFVLNDEGFALTLRAGVLSTVRSDDPPGETRLIGPPNLVAVAVYGPQQLAALGDMIRIEGDMRRGQEFVDLFALRR